MIKIKNILTIILMFFSFIFFILYRLAISPKKDNEKSQGIIFTSIGKSSRKTELYTALKKYNLNLQNHEVKENSLLTKYFWFFYDIEKRKNFIIHIVTPNITFLELLVLLAFRRRSIYDPVDIITGYVKPISVSDFKDGMIKLKLVFFVKSILQHVALNFALNIIFRDMQITQSNSLCPKKRRKRNTLFFADYVQNYTKIEKPEKIEGVIPTYVSLGNIICGDAGNGSAYVDICEKLLSTGNKVIFFLPSSTGGRSAIQTRFSKLVALRKKYSSRLELHDEVTEEELQICLLSKNYGLHIVGNHFLTDENSFRQCIFKNQLYSCNGSRRVTTYIQNKLIIMFARPKELTYGKFIIERYGYSIQTGVPGVVDNMNRKVKRATNYRSLKFDLDYNITRLVKYYENLNLEN